MIRQRSVAPGVIACTGTFCPFTSNSPVPAIIIPPMPPIAATPVAT